MVIKKDTLQGLANFLRQTITELNISVTNKGISLGYWAFGGLGGAIIDIPREAIKELTGEAILGIDTTQFAKIIDTFDEEELELTVEEDTILHLKSETQESHIRLILPDKDNQEAFAGLKKTILSTKLIFDVEELFKIFRITERCFGTNIWFEFDGDKKQLEVISEKTAIGFKKKINVKKGEGIKGRAWYQTAYLLDSLTGARGEIQMEIGESLPIRFTFTIGDTQIQSFVAPRTLEEG
jgi:hypothetical protein